jgi:hypothetical protein
MILIVSPFLQNYDINYSVLKRLVGVESLEPIVDCSPLNVIPLS